MHIAADERKGVLLGAPVRDGGGGGNPAGGGGGGGNRAGVGGEGGGVWWGWGGSFVIRGTSGQERGGDCYPPHCFQRREHPCQISSDRHELALLPDHKGIALATAPVDAERHTDQRTHCRGFVLFGVELDASGAVGQQPATHRPGWNRSLEEHPQMPATPRDFQVGGNPIGSETTTHRGQDRETVRLIGVKDREAARAVLIEQVRPESAGTAQVLTHDF